MDYRLLTEFRRVFEGRRYRHRSSTHGDLIALQLYEDLVAVGRSARLASRVAERTAAVNAANRARGIKARRGDGTFGELVPGAQAEVVMGYQVARGPIATVEIGCEVKILAKAMIKQIDRVITVLTNQVAQFRRGGGHPICVGIVGLNRAPHATGYEGNRVFRTDGRIHRHPAQEAAEAERRLVAEAKPHYDEFVVLNYLATNEAPYAFEWVDRDGTALDYGASLARISREYEKRF